MRQIGYTTGVFDLFHVGHLNILRQAKLECDYLIVGVFSDELCEKLKGSKPVIPFAERVEIVASIRFVDDVVPEVSSDKIEAWKNLRFHKIFKGDDWKNSPLWNTLEREFGQIGVKVVYFPYTRHTSSTQLREILDKLRR